MNVEIHPFFNVSELNEKVKIDREIYLSFIRKDLKHLLSLSEPDFNSLIKPRSSLISYVKTFLKRACRPYDIGVLNESVDFNTKNEQDVYSSSFMLLFRIVVDGAKRPNCISLGDILNAASIFFFSNPKPTARLLQTFFVTRLQYLESLHDVLLGQTSKLSQYPLQTGYDFSFTILVLLDCLPISCPFLLRTDFVVSIVRYYELFLDLKQSDDKFTSNQTKCNLLYSVFHILHQSYFSPYEFDPEVDEDIIHMRKNHHIREFLNPHKNTTKVERAQSIIRVLELIANCSGVIDTEEVEGETEDEDKEKTKETEDEKNKPKEPVRKARVGIFLHLLDKKYGIYSSLIHHFHQLDLEGKNTTLKEDCKAVQVILRELNEKHNLEKEEENELVNSRNPFIYPLENRQIESVHIGKRKHKNKPLEKEARERLVESMLYDDEYDDSFESVNLKTPMKDGDDPFKIIFGEDEEEEESEDEKEKNKKNRKKPVEEMDDVGTVLQKRRGEIPYSMEANPCEVKESNPTEKKKQKERFWRPERKPRRGGKGGRRGRGRRGGRSTIGRKKETEKETFELLLSIIFF